MNKVKDGSNESCFDYYKLGLSTYRNQLFLYDFL